MSPYLGQHIFNFYVQYVAVFVNTGLAGSFAGSAAPCAVAELENIGGFAGKTSQISTKLTELINKELKVDRDRFVSLTEKY